MARQRNWSRHQNATLSLKTWDQRFLFRCLLHLPIIGQSKRTIGAMKYIPTCPRFCLSVAVLLIWFILQRRPTSANLSCAAFGFSPSRLVISARYRFPSGLVDARSLIRVTQRLIKRSHCFRLAPCLWLMLMDRAISLKRSLTSLSCHCVVKPACFCQIHIVSAAHWLTPTLAFSAQMQTCTVSIWIILASATTDLHQQDIYRSGSHMQTSQTLRSTSPVLLSTSRCSQAPLELSKVLSDSARAFSGAPESTCSYGGAFRMLRNLTYRLVKFWSSWHLCAALREA